MLGLDTTTEFGARVQRRLREEQIVWLTTVRGDGLPQPSPVWFLWHGETALIYSRPATPKLRNIARNPQVALHFDGNGQGGDIVVLDAEARVTADAPAADEIAAYVEKYRAGMARLGMPPDRFAEAYSAVIRVTPTKVRGH